MNTRLISLVLLSTLITGCNQVPNDEHTLVLSAGLIFNFYHNSEDEGLAKILFDNAFYSFDSSVKIETTIVAGDQLSITFNSKYKIVCQTTYPGNCHVKGDIKSYKLIETQIFQITFESANDIRTNYKLDNDYVVLDEEGRYVSLSEFDGDMLYLSQDLQRTQNNCSCPDGAECEPCPIYVAGIYAYDPRPVL